MAQTDRAILLANAIATTMATRMRLTPQSRYGARSADTAARSVGDVEKPWEWNGKRGLE